jgi:very-short-patch-repair endonuclease
MANEQARRLRKTMMRQEVKLWVRLRALRAMGFQFRRQSAISSYIVDFECRRARLIVEVDAGSTPPTEVGSATLNVTRRSNVRVMKSFGSGTTMLIASSTPSLRPFIGRS